MAETLQGIYSVPPCITHTFDRVLRRHHSKNRQVDTYYLVMDAWRKHVSLDEGILKP
jgi:hypothetical protein